MNPLTEFKKIPILPLIIALALVVGAPALATPPCGVIPVALAPTGHFPSGLLDLMCRELPGTRLPWYLKMNVRGDSDLYIIQNTFPVGAHTGWHTHPGPSLITVISGDLTVYDSEDATCTPHVYHAGESFTDIGCGDVHLVRNEGHVEAVNVAVQIVPAGAARRIDADQPANCPVITCP
jgi:quercetin dioxygenase-like cupin family protein